MARPDDAAAALRTMRDSPWRAINEARRLAAEPYIRLTFALHGVRWGRSWRIFGVPIIQRHRGSEISAGDRLQLRSWRRTNPLVPNHPVVLATRHSNAVIRIGDDCGLTGATIVAAERVAVGNRVLIGANATIIDTDFHPLDPSVRRRDILAGRHAPIAIEDDVFIGMSAIILKGVTVGHGSVVAAGAVVTRDVPPNAVVAGNPAALVGTLDQLPVEDADVSRDARTPRDNGHS